MSPILPVKTVADYPEVMTARMVGELAHLSPTTVRAYADAGAIPCHRRGSRYLFVRAEIAAWLSRQVEAAAPAPAQEPVAELATRSDGSVEIVIRLRLLPPQALRLAQ